mgnify:CR=1 FL=1
MYYFNWKELWVDGEGQPESILILTHALTIGYNNIINTGSIIEHDVFIGNHNHIAPGAIINGGVTIGNNCFIGSGSIIKQGLNIKNNTGKVVYDEPVYFNSGSHRKKLTISLLSNDSVLMRMTGLSFLSSLNN